MSPIIDGETEAFDGTCIIIAFIDEDWNKALVFSKSVKEVGKGIGVHYI